MKSPALMVLAVVASVAPLAAQHPSFTGTWTLDVAHSDGGTVALTSGTYTIAMHGDTVVIDRELVTDLGSSKSHMVVGVNGQPWVNTVNAGGQSVELTTAAKWAMDTLVMRSTGTAGGSDAIISDRWLQAADGRSFTAIRDTEVDGQALPTSRMVYVRKP